MALQAVEIEDILICGFLLVPSATYRLFKIQRWDSPGVKRRLVITSTGNG